MRMTFHKVTGAEAEDLPVSYTWDGGGVPDDPTPEEVQMVLLFEIAESLKSLEFPSG